MRGALRASAWFPEKPRRLLGLFVGTQIGGGWIVDGRPCPGFPQAVGAFGHLVLDATGPKYRCGGRGCFESLASRRAVLDSIQAAIREGQDSVLKEGLENLGKLRRKDLLRAYRGRDPLTRRPASAQPAKAASAHQFGSESGTFVVAPGNLTE